MGTKMDGKWGVTGNSCVPWGFKGIKVMHLYPSKQSAEKPARSVADWEECIALNVSFGMWAFESRYWGSKKHDQQQRKGHFRQSKNFKILEKKK